jgi:hypothetical protein
MKCWLRETVRRRTRPSPVCSLRMRARPGTVLLRLSIAHPTRGWHPRGLMLRILATLTLLAPLTAVASHAPAAPPPSGIVFLEDDYRGALAEPRPREAAPSIAGRPGAPCLSMKSFVFPTPGFVRRRMPVWLSVETESERNREVVEKFRRRAADLLIIDPNTGRIGRWIGVSANEMRQFVPKTTADWRSAQRAPGSPRRRSPSRRVTPRSGRPTRGRGFVSPRARASAGDPLRPARVGCWCVTGQPRDAGSDEGASLWPG